jgi:hypothetical protein
MIGLCPLESRCPVSHPHITLYTEMGHRLLMSTNESIFLVLLRQPDLPLSFQVPSWTPLEPEQVAFLGNHGTPQSPWSFFLTSFLDINSLKCPFLGSFLGPPWSSWSPFPGPPVVLPGSRLSNNGYPCYHLTMDLDIS